jgi:hypothetical protein
MKELPGDIKTFKDKTEENDRERINKYSPKPRVSVDSEYTDEENGQYYWELHKKYNEYVKEWGNSMFGPDPDLVCCDTEVPKSIVRI